jgi:hypothetical protein
MATIKKGTYRFNDVLIDSENHWGQIDINFTLPITPQVDEETKTITVNESPYLCSQIMRIPSSEAGLVLYFGESMVYAEASSMGWNTIYVFMTSELGYNVDDKLKGYGQIITITDDFTSADEYDEAFVTWFNENAVAYTEPAKATITYNGEVIATIEKGQTATLSCKDKVMKDDVAIAVSGGGSAECDRKHIIEVDTLPTENISSTDIYMIKDVTVCVDMADEQYDSYRTFYDAFGMFFRVYNVDELPTTDIRVTINNVQLYVYYIKSTNTLHYYNDGSWVSVTASGCTPIMNSIDEYYKYTIELIDVIMDTGTKISLVERYRNQGANIELFGVDKYENVADPHPSNLETGAISLYYDESRDNVYVYSDGLWSSISYTVGAGCGGSITKLGDPTVLGHYYPLIEKGWKRAEWMRI